MYAAVEVQLYTFLISTLAGGEWSASRTGRSAPNGEQARCAPESVWPLWKEKTFLLLSGIEPQLPGRPVCSLKLYQLSYLGSPFKTALQSSIWSNLMPHCNFGNYWRNCHLWEHSYCLYAEGPVPIIQGLGTALLLSTGTQFTALTTLIIIYTVILDNIWLCALKYV
jgi:hypothetical protein